LMGLLALRHGGILRVEIYAQSLRASRLFNWFLLRSSNMFIAHG
jgi:hypothetical protein